MLASLRKSVRLCRRVPLLARAPPGVRRIGGETTSATYMATRPRKTAPPSYPRSGASARLVRENPSACRDIRRGDARPRDRCKHVASDFLELIGGGFAGAAVLGDLVAHLLAFAQIAETGALDSADVNENVRTAIIGLDESEALLTIEPFHSSGSLVVSPNIVSGEGPHTRGRVDRCLEEVVSGFVPKARPSRQAENRWAKDSGLRSSLQRREAPAELSCRPLGDMAPAS
jgi:hypothetical protein